MSDLSAMFQAAPSTAAFMMGQNHSLEQQVQQMRMQAEQARMQQLAQEMRMRQEEQPYNLEKLSLANQTSRAQLGGHQGTSDQAQLTAQKMRALLPDTIADERDKMQNDQLNRRLKTSNAFSEAMMEAAGELDKVDPMQRGQVFRSWLNSKGFPEDHPSAQHFLALTTRTHPNQLPDVLRNMAIQANKLKPAYTQAMDVQDSQNASHEQVARGNNTATKYVADKHLEAAQYRADQVAKSKALQTDVKARIIAAKGDPLKMQSIYKEAAAMEAFAQNDAKAEEYNYLAAQLQDQVNAQAGAQPKPGKPDPRGHGIATVPPPEYTPTARPPRKPAASDAAAPTSEPTLARAGESLVYRDKAKENRYQEWLRKQSQ